MLTAVNDCNGTLHSSFNPPPHTIFLTEWGQIVMMDYLVNYIPDNSKEAEMYTQLLSFLKQF